MKQFFLSLKRNYGVAANKGLLKRQEAAYFFKFTVLLLFLYYFNMFYVGVTDPRGVLYSAFLDRYLNYISWLRTAILHMANRIDHSLGIPSYMVDSYTLRLVKGPGVRMDFPCLGYGVMSFWIAFIGAQYSRWQRKLVWMLAGITAVWSINCLRVALLLIALGKRWQVDRYINQHDLFNLIAYLLIIAMMYIYYRSSRLRAAVTG